VHFRYFYAAFAGDFGRLRAAWSRASAGHALIQRFLSGIGGVLPAHAHQRTYASETALCTSALGILAFA
jgi:hypothetical protein